VHARYYYYNYRRERTRRYNGAQGGTDFERDMDSIARTTSERTSRENRD